MSRADESSVLGYSQLSPQSVLERRKILPYLGSERYSPRSLKYMAATTGKKRTSSKTKAMKKGASKLRAPIAMAHRRTTGLPSIDGNPYLPGGCVRIRHREYIAEMPGTSDGTFSVQGFSINPGIQATFPWLCSVAQNFEEYVFKKLHFAYETEQSTTAPGSLLMMVDYDAADAQPTSKTEIMAHRGATRTPIWGDTTFIATASDLFKTRRLYIRTGSLGPNLDIKTYDVGNFFVACQGTNTAGNLGELYVEYDVELYVPQLTPAVLKSAKLVSGSGISAAAPLGSDPVTSGDLPVVWSGSTLTVSTVGSYLVHMQLNYTGTGSGPGVSGSGTATVTTIQTNYGAGQSSTLLLVVVASPGQTLSLSVSLGAAVLTAGVLRVSNYQASLS